jgi:peptide/nickel transport system substrate-binding protein
MGKLGSRVAVLVFAALAMLGVAGCGGNGNEGGGGGKKGGSITVATTGLDNADPVMWTTTQSIQPMQLAYTALLTYKHEAGDAGNQLVPGLAKKVPTATNAGKTYKFQLRDGLKYSDGSPVKASDFENTIKRLLKLGSPWSSSFTVIEGTQQFVKKGDFKADISGIETNDKTGEITINLTEPDTKLLFGLGEPYAAPTLAAKSPAKSLKQPPPGVGPYVLDIVDFKRLYVLKRNPHWSHIPGIPDGNFDKITGRVSGNVTRMTQDVISGKADFMTEDPTGDQLPEVRQKYKDRLHEEPQPPNTYYMFLNSSIPPFDKLEARQAVNYAFDSNAEVRVFGGRLKPSCNFIPPGIEGYKPLDCKYGDPNGKGNIAKAKELVKKSGYEGMKVTAWTDNKDPRPAMVDYYRDLLNQIGFKADTKSLDHQVYFETVGLRRTKSQTGFTDWFQDYPHPGDFFENLLSTDALATEQTNNFGFVSDPVLDKKLDKLRGKDPKDTADEWNKLDDYVVNQKAYVLPYGNEKSTSFFSERMNAQDCAGLHPVYKNDWLLFCRK